MTLAIALLAVTALAGCQQKTTGKTGTSTSISEAAKQTAKITIKEDETPLTSKTITFTKGQTLYEAMKENFAIKDKDGFITSIENHQQDQSKNKYWTYTINGEMAMKGAKDIKLKAKDDIVFTLGVTQ